MDLIVPCLHCLLFTFNSRYVTVTVPVMLGWNAQI
jgi:hypothetical protein